MRQQEEIMLIKFQSQHAGNFIMFSDIALPLLQMMGMNANPQGAVSGAELRLALKSLELALEKASQPEPRSEPDDEDDDENDETTPPIALAARAAPLLDMLRKAGAEDSYIMWQPD
jgi:hypothetical protein